MRASAIKGIVWQVSKPPQKKQSELTVYFRFANVAAPAPGIPVLKCKR
jgi:hypothetical protein